MNPTDQARKEARKKELKKNKKQRQIVRTAVLKGKNPREIIEELEKIDDMEYNPITPCPLNQKVMYEKRRKLAETWDRVIKLYEKDAPEQYADLKKLWTNYQGRKIEVVKYYESVISAQDVEIDSIPLPNSSSAGLDTADWDDDGISIPLPPPTLYIPPGPPRSVLKKPPSVLDTVKPLLCPGVPSGPPPPIEDYEVVEVDVGSRKRTIRFGDEREEQEDKTGEELDANNSAPGQPNSLQKKMLAMAGQDLDQFMREMEEVHRTREAEKAADLQARLARLDSDTLEPTQPTPPGMELPGELDTSSYLLTGPPGAAPPGPPPGAPPMLYRPASHIGAPPLRPGVPPPGVRPPPGPPPGRLPVRQAAPIRPGQAPPGVRLPPGPPPGVPPRGARPNMPRPLGVVTAKPQLNKMEIKTGKVIEGAPVMRNLRSDVTRFVPTNLRVKRDDKKENIKRKPDSYRPYTSGGHSFSSPPQAEQHNRFARPSQPAATNHPPQKTKDDAYADFMKEMQDLL